MSVATIATLVPLYVSLRNDLKMATMTTRMSVLEVEQELMTLIAANNSTRGEEEVLVEGTFELYLETDSEFQLVDNLGTYQIRKTTFFDLISVTNFVLHMPVNGTFPVGPSPYVLIYADSWTPALDSANFARFSGDNYIPINATGANALGFPCAVSSPATCVISPGRGVMPSLANSIWLDPTNQLEFRVTPATDFVGQTYQANGEFKVDLSIQLKMLE